MNEVRRECALCEHSGPERKAKNGTEWLVQQGDVHGEHGERRDGKHMSRENSDHSQIGWLKRKNECDARRSRTSQSKERKK